MNRGTKQGDEREIEFVKLFNKSKNKYSNYIQDFNKTTDKVWMCRVTTKQLSTLSNQKVFTRSDCYLIETNDNLISLLKKNDYYLSEDLLSNSQCDYNFIPHSGISVKMSDSDKFQIIKLQPDSFYNLFDNYELGAGASIFCLREEELSKNESVFAGWKTSKNAMLKYFSMLNLNSKFDTNIEMCKKIKEYSNKKIKEIIDSSEILKKKIFNGDKLYKEPYTAWYLNHGDSIVPLTYIPFNVTTGSGRSHGDFTIVLKPQN